MKKTISAKTSTAGNENNYSCKANIGQVEGNYPGRNMARTPGLNVLTVVKGTTKNILHCSSQAVYFCFI